MMHVSLQNLSAGFGTKDIVNDVSFDINAGEVVGLIGPNGAGKTTLMRAALGLIPSRGTSSLAALSHNARSKAVAWMPQAREIAWRVSVEDLVMLGRLPHHGSGQSASDLDQAKTTEALDQMGLSDFRTRTATELSGGEQARVLIARAIAQDTPLIMADEPTAGLDPAHQITTLDAFSARAAQGGSCLVSIHDLGLAARHCTRLILLQKGRVVADGPAEVVLTPTLLAEVFDVEAHFETGDNGPIYQTLRVIP
jgi:iron complex transport system ATP-binding protein